MKKCSDLAKLRVVAHVTKSQEKLTKVSSQVAIMLQCSLPPEIQVMYRCLQDIVLSRQRTKSFRSWRKSQIVQLTQRAWPPTCNGLTATVSYLKLWTRTSQYTRRAKLRNEPGLIHRPCELADLSESLIVESKRQSHRPQASTVRSNFTRPSVSKILRLAIKMAIKAAVILGLKSKVFSIKRTWSV